MDNCQSCKTLQKRIDSLGEKITAVELELKTLQEINNTLEMEKRQWIEEKIKQQMIIKQHLANGDNTVRQLQDEIRFLKRIIKKYEPEYRD